MRAGRFKIPSSSARIGVRARTHGGFARRWLVLVLWTGGVSAEEHALVVYEERFHGTGALITLPDPRGRLSVGMDLAGPGSD
jgi:hypothetical protein